MKKIWQEYLDTKQKNESWLMWLLHRKLPLAVNLLIALALTALFVRYCFDLVFMVRFFKFVFILSILVIIYELYINKKEG